MPASELVDRIVPLQDLWARDDVEKLVASLARQDARRSLAALSDELVARTRRPDTSVNTGATMPVSFSMRLEIALGIVAQASETPKLRAEGS